MAAVVTVVNSYSVQPTDELINVVPSAVGVTMLMPQLSSVPVGKAFVFKDIGGAAATYNITVGARAGFTVDGSASTQIVNNYGVLTVVATPTGWTSVENPVTLTGIRLAFTDNTNVTTGYTLVAGDCGKLVRMNLSVSRALTLPNDLPAGFNCDVVQTGLAAGQVVYTAASGSTLTGNSAVTTSAGIWARCSLYVNSNSSGTAAVYVLSGNVGV